jgi:uncharacterized membrane protein YphA (DoxX/SURF4 family)
VQRWYRTFPHGLPGIGLLVLRLAIGPKLIIAASSCMLDEQGFKFGVWLLCLFALGTGTSFVLGFLTRLAAGVSVAAGAAVYFYHPAWASSFLNLLSPDTMGVALAIALLGPGAISLDAYFFGRRKILIPPVARP